MKGAANPRTGKANAEKVSKYLEDKLRAKVCTQRVQTSAKAVMHVCVSSSTNCSQILACLICSHIAVSFLIALFEVHCQAGQCMANRACEAIKHFCL